MQPSTPLHNGLALSDRAIERQQENMVRRSFPRRPDFGPGSAFGGQSWARVSADTKLKRRRNPFAERSRRAATNGKDQTKEQENDDGPTKTDKENNSSPLKDRQSGYIGSDLVQWHEQEQKTSNDETVTKARATPKKVTFEDEQGPKPINHQNENSKGPQTSKGSPDTLFSMDVLPAPRRAIGFDTRFLDTKVTDSPDKPQGSYLNDAVPGIHDEDYGTRITNHGIMICREYQGLLETLIRRGAPPCIVAQTVATAEGEKTAISTTSTTLEVPSTTFEDFYQSHLDKMIFPTISGAGIPSLVQAFTDKSPVYSSIPSSLSAKEAWKGLESLVENIMSKETEANPEVRSPLGVTLLTTDLALFCQPDPEAHKRGATSLLDHMSAYFRSGLLSEIKIVVASTWKLGLKKDETVAEINDQDEHEDRDADVVMQDVSLATAQITHQSTVKECIYEVQALIEAHLETNWEEELERSEIGICSQPVCVSLSLIEHSTVGYKNLSRQWIRTILDNQHIGDHRLQLQLPELEDGTQCSVALEVEYHTLPFPVRSSETQRLMTDLSVLTKSKVQISRIIPFSSLDASLLYGVPMRVKAALEGNVFQSQEMAVLVRSLFQYLVDRQVVLLLTTEKGKVDYRQSQPLFPLSAFVLMAQHSSETSSHTGLLFRFALHDQLLAEASETSGAPTLDEVDQFQYDDYIERAMESFEPAPFNPLDHQGLKDEMMQVQKSQETNRQRDSDGGFHANSVLVDTKGQDFWDDSVGVGSRRSTKESDDDASKADEQDDLLSDKDPKTTDESMDNVWGDSVGVGSRIVTSQKDHLDDEEATSESDASMIDDLIDTDDEL